MRKPEQKFWDLLKNNKVLPGDISRVENTADVGTPDLSCAYGKDYWVELKAVEDIYAGKRSDLLESSQRVWHARRVKMGSLIFVLTRYDDVIQIEKCVGTNLYQTLMIVSKIKNTFDYATIKKLIEGEIESWESPWFM